MGVRKSPTRGRSICPILFGGERIGRSRGLFCIDREAW